MNNKKLSPEEIHKLATAPLPRFNILGRSYFVANAGVSEKYQTEKYFSQNHQGFSKESKDASI